MTDFNRPLPEVEPVVFDGKVLPCGQWKVIVLLLISAHLDPVDRILFPILYFTHQVCALSCKIMISVRTSLILKGVDKKPTWQRTSHSQSLLSGEQSSEKKNLSKIEKTGGRQQAFGPLALAPCFFNF